MLLPELRKIGEIRFTSINAKDEATGLLALMHNGNKQTGCDANPLVPTKEPTSPFNRTTEVEQKLALIKWRVDLCHCKVVRTIMESVNRKRHVL